MERRVFWVLFVAVFATTAGISIIEPLMAIYSESLGASGVYIGLIFAAFTIGRGIFTPIAGKLSDHHGRRNFILAGLAVYTAASFLYIAADNPEMLTAIRLVQGLSTAFVAPLAMAYIGDIAPANKEGSYMGTFTISMFAGLAAGPVIGGSLNHFYGMPAAFAAMGALGTASLLLVLLKLPELGVHNKRKPTRIMQIIKDKAMQEILLIRLVTSFGVAGFIVFLPLYATGLGLNTAQIGAMVTLNLAATALPQMHFGKLADRHDKTLMIVIGNAVMASMILAIPLAHGFAELLAVNILMGLGGAISIPANTALAAQFGKKHGMGSAMGLLQTAFAAGMVAGPLIAGAVLDLAGIAMVFVQTAAIVFAGSAAFYLFVKNNKKMHSAHA